MELTRRNFVKTTAVALASAAAAGTMGGCSSSLAGTGDDAAATGGDTTKTVGVCRFCGCGCGVIVRGQGRQGDLGHGRPGERLEPWPELREGLLPGRRSLYGEDRLTTPLIRDDKSTKGTPDGLREATWDEALDLVAGKLRDTWKADKSRLAFWGKRPAAHRGGLLHGEVLEGGPALQQHRPQRASVHGLAPSWAS